MQKDQSSKFEATTYKKSKKQSIEIERNVSSKHPFALANQISTSDAYICNINNQLNINLCLLQNVLIIHFISKNKNINKNKNISKKTRQF